ncbi:hypothetical protein HDK64DRAFT_74760 [Phyllosticta capitalensis]
MSRLTMTPCAWTCVHMRRVLSLCNALTSPSPSLAPHHPLSYFNHACHASPLHFLSPCCLLTLPSLRPGAPHP